MSMNLLCFGFTVESTMNPIITTIHFCHLFLNQYKLFWLLLITAASAPLSCRRLCDQAGSSARTILEHAQSWCLLWTFCNPFSASMGMIATVVMTICDYLEYVNDYLAPLIQLVDYKDSFQELLYPFMSIVACRNDWLNKFLLLVNLWSCTT